MENIRDMVDCIASDDFDSAREHLKHTLAGYMMGEYVSNKELFGDDYDNPNESEQKLASELTETKYDTGARYECDDCECEFTADEADIDEHGEISCPECGSENVTRIS